MKMFQNAVVWASWVIILWGFSQAKPFLVPILLAVLLAFLMNPLIQFLEKKKIPEWLSIAISAFVLFFPVIILMVFLLREGSILIKDYPHIVGSIRRLLESVANTPMIQGLNVSQYLDLNSITAALSDDAGQSIRFVLSGLRALFEASTHLLIILFFSVLMIASRKHLRKSADRLLGSNPKTLEDIISLIEKFLIARLGIAGLVMLLDFIILKSFGAKYNLLFAVILGLSTFVPIVGFILGIIPPLVTSLALGNSIGYVSMMVSLIYVVAFFEGHFVTPKFLGKKLNLNLFVTFLGLFGGELLWGVWGMVLSIPILGVIRIILNKSPEYSHYSEIMAEKTSTPIITKTEL
jgi:predicted PurR-regulated permease PerM